MNISVLSHLKTNMNISSFVVRLLFTSHKKMWNFSIKIIVCITSFILTKVCVTFIESNSSIFYLLQVLSADSSHSSFKHFKHTISKWDVFIHSAFWINMITKVQVFFLSNNLWAELLSIILNLPIMRLLRFVKTQKKFLLEQSQDRQAV